MINQLQLSRPEEVKQRISLSLKESNRKKGGMSELTKRKISDKMKSNWHLKKMEEQNKEKSDK